MPFNVPLTGRIEPPSDSWQAATDADRRAFYRRAGEVGVRELRRQLARALGADGRKMTPRKRPRADGANGPVLSPHDAASRTMRLLAFRAWARGVTLFWHGGMSKKQRLPWATILGFHAGGKYNRDVRASDKTVKAVASEMETWWQTRQRKKAERKRRRPGEGTPGAASPYEYPGRRAYLDRQRDKPARPPAPAATPPQPSPPRKRGVFGKVVDFVKGAYRKAKGWFGYGRPQ